MRAKQEGGVAVGERQIYTAGIVAGLVLGSIIFLAITKVIAVM